MEKNVSILNTLSENEIDDYWTDFLDSNPEVAIAVYEVEDNYSSFDNPVVRKMFIEFVDEREKEKYKKGK